MQRFVYMVNVDKPDLVLDLGDCIEGEITSLYNYHTNEEAAQAQQYDWLKAWKEIDNRLKKEVALGNRDIAVNYPLTDYHWVEALGYEDRAIKGGSKLQTSFMMENDQVNALVFVLCDYSDNYDKSETLNWIQTSIVDFKGDWIIFFNHRILIYPYIRDILIDENVTVPAIYIHGHNHGSDTLTRDAWGYEVNEIDFPSYLLVNLHGTGLGVKFEFYPDGNYEFYRIDVRDQTISEPYIHYQTRVEYEDD